VEGTQAGAPAVLGEVEHPGASVLDSSVSFVRGAMLGGAHGGAFPIEPGQIGEHLGAIALDRSHDVVRAGVLDAINSNYVDYQNAMGVPRRVVIWRYVLRNALIGTVTQLGLIFGNLIANAVVVEAVFDWPGLGLYAANSILRSDYNAIMGFTLIMGAVFIVANLLVDIVHGLIDPREAG